MDPDPCKRMSTIALLLLLLIFATGTTIEAYQSELSSNLDQPKTVHEDEAVKSRNVAAGPDEPFEALRSERKESGVEHGKTGGSAVRRKSNSDVLARYVRENHVNVRRGKEKYSHTRMKREAENPSEAENKILNRDNDVTVKSDIRKPLTEEESTEDRNMKRRENSNVSPSRDKVGKHALVNTNVNNGGTQSAGFGDTGLKTANVEKSIDKNVKGRSSENSKVDRKGTAGTRGLGGEVEEGTENDQETGSRSAEKVSNNSLDRGDLSSDKTKSSSSPSQESTATRITAEAEPRSISRLLVRQSVPISRVAFESDLESLSPELRALQAGSSALREKVPPVSEVMEDIRNRPMVSRIKYAKETLFPPVVGQPSSDPSSLDTSKTSLNPYKESWEITSDPMMIKLMKSESADLDHRMQPLESSQRLSPEEQLESPVPDNKKAVVEALMKQLEKLATQFSKVVHFITSSTIPDLGNDASLEWVISPDHRFYSNATSALGRKLSSLSNKLAAVKKSKKKLDGKDKVFPLSENRESLSSELAVDEALRKRLEAEDSKYRNYPGNNEMKYRSPAARSLAHGAWSHRHGE